MDSVDKSEQETPVAGPVDVQEEVEALLPEEKQEERREPENKDAASEPRESCEWQLTLQFSQTTLLNINIDSYFSPTTPEIELG